MIFHGKAVWSIDKSIWSAKEEKSYCIIFVKDVTDIFPVKIRFVPIQDFLIEN